MVDFNPASARHPVVVKQYLDATTYPGGDQLVGINVVQNLARIESDRSRVDADRGRMIAETIRGPLLESARALTNMSEGVLTGVRTMAANQARAEEQLKQRVKSPLERNTPNAGCQRLRRLLAFSGRRQSSQGRCRQRNRTTSQFGESPN